MEEERRKEKMLPSIEKLARIPDARLKGKPRPITDGSTFMVTTRNCGSFAWTTNDAVKFNSCRYDHKFSFVALVMAWAKVKSKHYWRDCRLTVQVVAETLNYTIPEYLCLRGWSADVDENGSPRVEYRKLKECLSRSHEGGRYIELYAMIGRCVSQIEDDKRWEEAAIILAADKVRNKIGRLSHAFHTAYLVVKELLWPVVPCAADKTKQDEFIEFLDNVFKGCKTRKSIITGCHCVLVTFTSIDKVFELKDKLAAVAKESPQSVLTKIQEKDAMSFNNRSKLQLCYAALIERLTNKCNETGRKKRRRKQLASAMDFVRWKIHNEYFVMHPTHRPDVWPGRTRNPSPGPDADPPIPPPPPNDDDNAADEHEAEDEAHLQGDQVETLGQMTASVGDLPTEHTSTPMSTRSRRTPSGSPEGIRLALASDLRTLELPWVYVRANHDGYQARTLKFKISPGEFYSITGLRRHPHGMVFDPPSNQMVASTIVPMAASQISCSFTVIRTSHEVWLDHFGSLRLEPQSIIRLVLDNSVSDPTRDRGGHRVDFGNCGHSWERTSNVAGIPTRPRTLVGLGIFNENNSRLRRQIGRLLDCMQACLDRCCDLSGTNRCFDNHRRTSMFALKLREALGARRFRFEWVTIQLKCITRGDETLEHTDSGNCTWPGYDRTTAFCLLLMDNQGFLWSLKVIGNSRKVAGDYLRARVTATDSTGMSPLTQLVSTCRIHLNRVQETCNLIARGRTTQTHAVSAMRPHEMFLDDEIVYDRMHVGRGQNTIQFVHTAAGMSRDFWLSPGVHWLHRWRVMGKDRDDLITAAWLCSYQVSWYKFWVVAPKLESIWDMEECFLQEFSTFFGGLHTRFSPPSFSSLYDLFGRQTDHRKQNVVDILSQTIDWVERQGDNCTTEDFKELLKGRASTLRPHRVEMGEFRLTVFVQLCVLSGIARKGCGVLTKSYPVKERGSYQQLLSCHVREEDHEIALELLSFELGLGRHRGDYTEGLCCESREERKHIVDALFKGMNLYHLMWDNGSARYKSFVKIYGSYGWTPVIGAEIHTNCG